MHNSHVHQLFEVKDVQYANGSIHDFFDNYSLREAVKEIDSIIKAAASDKAWEKDYPYSLIYYMEKVEELSGAALSIHYN